MEKKRSGKKVGNYITINIKNIDIISYNELNEAINIFAEELKKIIQNVIIVDMTIYVP